MAVARAEYVALPEVESPEEAMSRREFLNYAWLASLFAMPRFKAGKFGGTFTMTADQIPAVNVDPVPYNDGKFWLSTTEKGIAALYKVCTHLGCIYDWKPTEDKFICPCHGSQFQRDGTFISGPAPRSLDRFPIVVLNASGTEIVRSDTVGNPMKVSGQDVILKVDTGKRILGKPRGQRY